MAPGRVARPRPPLGLALLLGAAALAASACGQRGPLVLPKATPAAQPPTASASAPRPVSTGGTP
ncbi:LPS translocon maturation chaperone LptM [Ideonella livida]|uniref:LPS translocon maturation chaperone LptM n=1 Tax=Ideonella livida TaxID=2707176 RepID=UPI0035BEE3E0